MTVGFVHDGLSLCELYLDGTMIARKEAISLAMPAITSAGIFVGNSNPILSDSGGNWEGAGPLLGSVDDIKIWRLDPQARRRQFFGRPMDESTADAWEDFSLRLGQELGEVRRGRRFVFSWSGSSRASFAPLPRATRCGEMS